VGAECLSVEGASRAVFDGIDETIGWPLAPRDAKATAAAH